MWAKQESSGGSLSGVLGSYGPGAEAEGVPDNDAVVVVQPRLESRPRQPTNEIAGKGTPKACTSQLISA